MKIKISKKAIKNSLSYILKYIVPVILAELIKDKLK